MKITLSKLWILFIATTFLASSCQKDMDEGATSIEPGKGKVSLTLAGASFKEPTSDKVRKATAGRKTGTASYLQTQTKIIPFNEEYNVIATLTPISTKSTLLKASTSTESVSNGPLVEPLPEGLTYTVNVFEKDNFSKLVRSKYFTHGVDDSDISFDLAPGAYTIACGTYVDYGYNDARNNGVFFRENIDIKEGENINLNLTFQYMFSRATLTLNAENIGTIESIGGIQVAPLREISEGVRFSFWDGSINYVSIGHTQYFDFGPLTYRSNSIWTSRFFPLRTGSNEAEINVTSVVIDGVKGDIRLYGLVIEDGVQYDLQFRLGPKTDKKTFKIAGLEFAPENLMYNEENGYYFLNSSFTTDGSHFYPNYVKPRTSQPSLSPDPMYNGGPGDPCALVEPLNTWRLPTADEMKYLLENNGTILTNFSYFPSSPVVRKPNGVFFGTTEHPTDRYKFLFLPLANYGGNISGDDLIDEAGRYLLKDGGDGYAQLALSLYNAEREISQTGEPRILEAPAEMTMSVRCVKNN